jgi:hypothetical protein
MSLKFSKSQHAAAKAALLLTEDQLSKMPKAQQATLRKFREDPDFESLREVAMQKRHRNPLKGEFRPGTKLKMQILTYLIVAAVIAFLIWIVVTVFILAWQEYGYMAAGLVFCVTAVICGFIAEYFELKKQVRELMGGNTEKLEGESSQKAIKGE